MGKDAILTLMNDPAGQWVGRVLSSIPTSYTVFYDAVDALYRAECNIRGGTDYSGTDAATVIQAAQSGVPEGALFLRNATYNLASGLALKRVIGESLEGVILKATADITMIERSSGYDAELTNLTLDMNSIASRALYIHDCLYGQYKVKIKNVPANGVGIEINCTNSAVGTYYQNIWAHIEGVSQAAGSVGIKIDSAYSPVPYLTEQRISGHAYNLDYGVKVLKGMEITFDKFRSQGNNYGFDISPMLTTLQNCHEEFNDTKGVIVRNGASVLMIGGYREKFEVEGTGKAIYICPEANPTISVLALAPAQRTPRIEFSAYPWNNLAFEMLYDKLIVRDVTSAVDVFYLFRTGDFQALLKGKGIVLTNAAGDVTKRVRLNDAGDGLIFEVP
jgi:hypothetical protein